MPSASETSPLLKSDDVITPTSKQNRYSFRVILEFTVLISAVLIIVCTVGYYAGTQPASKAVELSVETSSAKTKTQSSKYLRSTTDAGKVSITVTNEYSNRPGFKMFDYPFLSGAYLMEPYRESTVSVTGLSADCGVSWTLEAVTESSTSAESKTTSLSGYSTDATVFTVLTAGTGQYTFKLQQPDCTSIGATTVKAEYEFPVWVKYVRRELMSLTDNDREEFLDAMKVLWDVNTVDGKALYGDEYKSLHYMATIHIDSGSSGYCDEFHVGPGFLNNHVMLGAFMEQSLQLVNPRTCLHYMDYTMYFEKDAFRIKHQEDPNDGGKWTELLTAKWFGSNDPYTGRIMDGRWANTEVPFMDDAFFEKNGVDKYRIFFPAEKEHWFEGSDQAHFYNPYGLLRSPWNFSPDPFVLRFNNVDRLKQTKDIAPQVLKRYFGVHCSDYGAFIQQDVLGQPLETCLVQIEGNSHGYAHFTIAGTGGELTAESDEHLKEQFGFTDSDIMYTTQRLQTIRKEYITKWMAGEDSLFVCTEFPFDYDTATLAENPSISCDVAPYYLQNEATVDEFLNIVYTGTADYCFREHILSLDFEPKKRLIKSLASRHQVDGELAGASAALDPIFWVLHGALERFFQRIVFEDVLSDMDYSIYKSCSGHSFNGTKEWLADFHFEDRSVDAKALTNQQLLNILNPLTEEYASHLNFVYDSSSWDWCSNFNSYFVPNDSNQEEDRSFVPDCGSKGLSI